MKKILLVLTGVIVATISGFTFKKSNWIRPFDKINKEVNKHSRAYETLGEATKTIGHRLTGSTNGQKAEEFAHNLFVKYGITDVAYQPFEVESWMRDTVSLSIAPGSSDNFRDLEVVALAHSPVHANLQGEIVDVGNGLEDDFEAVKNKIRGKIALANIGLDGTTKKSNLHRSEKTALAIKYGATGIIMINAAPGNILLTGTASVTGALIPIPAVCVSNESGKEIRSWAAEEGPLEAQIGMHNFSKPIKARNVIATIKGRSEEKVIIGGHLDSWDLATGAIDNGIGSFAVLDIARTFKKLNIKPEKTIQFVLFMGEEQGLLGSKHFVKELKKSGNLGKVAYMINLDMTNDPRGVNLFGRDEMGTFFSEINESIKSVYPEFVNETKNKASLHSDHQPFLLEGVPIAAMNGHLEKNVLNCYHADCDSFDLVNKAQLENTVRVGSMYLYALSQTVQLPVKKFSDTNTRDFLISQGLKTELILGQDWRWDE